MTSITAVVNLHREGYLCKPTLTSVVQARQHANQAGISTGVLIVLDKGDETTKQVVHNQKEDDWGILEVTEGDLGRARNAGVANAAGEMIAFLDGDDLWCDNWLTACVRSAANSTRKAIWHPFLNFYFGAESRVFHHIDMESDEFDVLDLLFSNLWTALACTHRSVLAEIPYPSTDLKRQIGYEDWGWNLRTIERGYIHKTIPGTAHAIRIKDANQSLVKQTTSAGAMPANHKLFRSLLKPPEPRAAFER